MVGERADVVTIRAEPERQMAGTFDEVVALVDELCGDAIVPGQVHEGLVAGDGRERRTVATIRARNRGHAATLGLLRVKEGRPPDRKVTFTVEELPIAWSWHTIDRLLQRRLGPLASPAMMAKGLAERMVVTLVTCDVALGAASEVDLAVPCMGGLLLGTAFRVPVDPLVRAPYGAGRPDAVTWMANTYLGPDEMRPRKKALRDAWLAMEGRGRRANLTVLENVASIPPNAIRTGSHPGSQYKSRIVAARLFAADMLQANAARTAVEGSDGAEDTP